MWGVMRRVCRAPSHSKTSRAAIRATLIAISLGLVALLVQSFLHLPGNLQLSQQCRMSRMWPSYVQHHPPSPSAIDAKYSLYLYREAYPGRSAASQSSFSGRPALFVPGNAGSFGQVRSVASSAHHLFSTGQGGANVEEVDWWSVDFNEDFSALHGQTMHEQAKYLNEVIAFLLLSYPDAKQVPILAHSMGGIVSRLMLLKSNHPEGSVNTIITLSTPHAYPPVPLEQGIEDVYKQVNTRWQEHASEVLLISLSGGILDSQLSSEPASLSLGRIWHRNTSISAFTSSLPALWGGVDHLAMMWCDQLRERLARGVLRIEGQGKSVQDRRKEWMRMIGVESDERIPSLSADASPPTDGGESTVQVSELRNKGTFAFELITSLPVGLDSSFGPPIDQTAVLRVNLCQGAGTEEQCRHVMPSMYQLLPPSPRLQPDTGASPSFPHAEERYEVPGRGLRLLRLKVKDLEEWKIDRIQTERKDGTDGGLLIFVLCNKLTIRRDRFLSLAGADSPLVHMTETPLLL